MEKYGMISFIKLALLALPVVLFLAGILIFTSSQTRGRKVRRKLRGAVLSLALILAVAYTAGFMGLADMQDGMESSVTISLNYANASKGLYPNGTRFNTYDVLSDEILENAIIIGQLGELTPRQLRSALSVEPLEAGSKISADHYYVSTEYVLRYTATGDTAHLNSADIVNAVAEAFSENFTRLHSRKTNVLEPDLTRLDGLDYLDKVELLDKYASDIADYLAMCSEESMTYSYTDGETFDSLQSKVTTLSDVELERLNSYILVKGLSMDVAQQISKLSYLNQMNDLEAQKNTKSYEIHLEAIRMYERDIATIVLIPTRDKDGEFYMSRTNIGVDYLADNAKSFSASATNAMTATATNNYAIGQLRSSAAGDQDYQTADELIASVCASLSAYAQKGLAMVEEFDAQTTGDALTFGADNTSGSMNRTIKIGILMALMTVSAAVFLTALTPGTCRCKKN